VRVWCADSTDIRNNILYKPNGIFGITLDYSTKSHYVNIDYNQYVLNSSVNYQAQIENTDETGSVSYTWSAWQGLGFETHGSTGALTLTDTTGVTPTSYNVVANSSTIDAGTSLTYFTNAYDLTNRPVGSFWDIGAFETVQGTPQPPVLTTPANETVGQYITSTFIWGSVTGATSYDYQVDRYVKGSGYTSYASGTQAGITLVKTLPLNNVTYRWRVRATASSVTSAWSSYYSFSTTSCK
jgi:hypothetical protein